MMSSRAAERNLPRIINATQSTQLRILPTQRNATVTSEDATQCDAACCVALRWLLTGPCSTEEIASHRYRARTRRCSSGPFCRNYDCYLRHHCPAGDRCRKGSDCSFFAADDEDLHYSNPEQLEPAFKWVEAQPFSEKLKRS